MCIDRDIETLDLECVAYKVCRDEGWSLEKTDRIENEYRAFWQLIRENISSEMIAPTRDIDVFWHHHVLDTWKYQADCDAIFGFFLHHYPYSGIFDEADAALQRARVVQTVAAISQKLLRQETMK
jgi:hypothetical protein